MKLRNGLALRLIVFQIILVCWVQVSTTSQRILSGPALIFFIYIFLKRLLDTSSDNISQKFNPVHQFFILAVFLVLTLNIFISNDKNIMKQIMFGWDFVGHFGVFRWGLTHIQMFTSTEFNSRNYIESYLDSNYPQTWALWGANFFRWIPMDNFYIMKALLFFSICTLLIAYIVFFSTYQEFKIRSQNTFYGSKDVNNLQRVPKFKAIDVAFITVLLTFISFCWNINSPHFALSTALIFRAIIVSQIECHSKSMDLDNAFLIFAAFILYPLTIIFSGVYFYNYFRKTFTQRLSIKRIFVSFEISVYIAILLASLGLVFIKADKSIKLSTLIFSYGGITFPSFVLIGLILIGLVMIVYSKMNLTQLSQLVCATLPLLLLDLVLVLRNGEVSYYGAKSTIAFMVIASGLFMTFTFNKRLVFLHSKSIPMIFTTVILILGATFFSRIEPIFDDANKRGVPMAFKRAFNSFDLQKDWLSADLVTNAVKQTESDSSYMPLFTGGYPYLGNMWLALLGRYPNEIFAGTGDLISGQLPIKLDYTNPIAYLSRSLNTEELKLFQDRFPYITVINSND
jgi:hypothetical protein